MVHLVLSTICNLTCNFFERVKEENIYKAKLFATFIKSCNKYWYRQHWKLTKKEDLLRVAFIDEECGNL